MRMFKSLYKDNGVELTKEGLEIRNKLVDFIEPFYRQLRNMNYSPSECKEILISSAYISMVFTDSLLS